MGHPVFKGVAQLATCEQLTMNDILAAQPKASHPTPFDRAPIRWRHLGLLIKPLIASTMLIVVLWAVSPVSQAQSFRDAGASATAQGPVTNNGQYVVTKGDSLFGISRRFGVSLDQLQTWNNLANSSIWTGQRLQVRTANVSSTNTATSQTYTVQRGDTAFAIAKRFGLSLDALARLNRLDPDFTLSVGQTLQLGTSMASVNAPTVSEDAVVEPSATGSIAAQPSNDATAARDTVSTGDVRVTAGAQVAATGVADLPDDDQPVQTKSVDTTTIQLARRRLAEPVTQPVNEELLPLPSNPSAEDTGRRFIWPVRGRVLSGFGPREGGLINDGINIAVREGEDVRAAASGKVIFASDRFHALGNLILVEHKDGWVTAYAHNDQMRVATGDRVQQGQVIALAGSSGTVDRSQLHFEIRQNGTPVNPLNFLQF